MMSVGMTVTPILNVVVIFVLVLIRNVQHVYTIVQCQICGKRIRFLSKDIYIFFSISNFPGCDQ